MKFRERPRPHRTRKGCEELPPVTTKGDYPPGRSVDEGGVTVG